jgi:uncharacterized protein with PIN domain
LSALYLETSALLSWLLDEPQAPGVREAVTEAEAVVTSSLTRLETERALHRAVSERVLREVQAQRLRGILARQQASWIVMAVSDAVLDRAGRAFPVEPVRSLDAIHLASALAFAEALPDLRMLTHDHRLLENATSLGLV